MNTNGTAKAVGKTHTEGDLSRNGVEEKLHYV